MKNTKTQSKMFDRLRLKSPQRSAVPLGVAWYTAECWARLKEAAADPARFEATFEEWVAMAELALKKMAVAGLYPCKVPINPDEFFTWCKAHGKPNDAAARAQFVSLQVKPRATRTGRSTGRAK